MAISEEVQYLPLDQLYLDPMNPRLGRGNTGSDVRQETVMDLMQDWTLDELAVSFIESSFWPQEALIVVREKLYGKERTVVIEGNRRLAALKFLKAAVDGRPASRRWADIATSAGKIKPTLFSRIPCIFAASRRDIEAFLGFRHVTGIKEWKPAEKAEYIAKLVEEGHMTYDEVMRKIGSKTSTVRQHYISYRLLLQMEDEEDISIEHVEEKFSVLYLALRTNGVQRYLDIDIKADPKKAKMPVPRERLKALANFAIWLFGDKKRPPLFTDSRKVDEFGTILESKEAVDYLERSEKPVYDIAFQTAGGDEPEIIRSIQRASDNIELALTRVHLHTKSEKLQLAVERFGADAMRLLGLFPNIKKQAIEEAR